MKKNIIIIILIFIVIALIGFIFIDKANSKINITTNTNSGELLVNSQKNNIENNDNNLNQEYNSEKDNVLLSHDYMDYKELTAKENIDTSNIKHIQFYELKPGEDAEKVIKLNNKDIQLALNVYECSGVVSYKNKDSSYIKIDYTVEINSTKGHKGTQIFYDTNYDCYEMADATTLDINSAIKKFNVKYGIIKDAITNEEYIVFYNKGEDTYIDSLYIYNDEGSLILKVCYDDIYGYGNPVPTESNSYENVMPMDFFENQILYYDMYVNTEKGENVQESFEECSSTNSPNSLRKITI